MGRKTAMESDVLRVGPWVNAVSTPDIVEKYKACFEGVGKVTDNQVKIHVNEKVNPVAQHEPAFKAVRNEFTVLGKLMLRGTRLVIPRKLRKQVLDLAHEGHQGMV